ncbi:hypothetical protein LMG29542_07476 [Paraburkholderia humisilvae]|uniref:Uncharacterized protein n=1 Tax=Paraburkholderia humisilvae TaxID=627669 RepID=A0A6J5F8B9_9BURK|nr:hypothetical protein LMG29542_07476 [Paraburkholderia humisilvae]
MLVLDTTPGATLVICRSLPGDPTLTTPVAVPENGPYVVDPIVALVTWLGPTVTSDFAPSATELSTVEAAPRPTATEFTPVTAAAWPTATAPIPAVDADGPIAMEFAAVAPSLLKLVCWLLPSLTLT